MSKATAYGSPASTTAAQSRGIEIDHAHFLDTGGHKQHLSVSSAALQLVERQTPELERSADPITRLAASQLQDLVSPTGRHAALFSVVGNRPLVWVQDALCRAELGNIHARGLAGLGLETSGLIHVRTRRPIDTLWVMEEALRAGLSVIGEIEAGAQALDFTATRRLEMRARRAGLSCWLVRVGCPAQTPGASAAHHRWHVMPHPSAPHSHDPKSPGPSRWVLQLMRARDRPPGTWVVEHDGGAVSLETARGLRVVAPLADGRVDTPPGTANAQHTGGTVTPFRTGRTL